MANHKSSAAQAIKDMLELGIDVTFFTGHITELHVLNAKINIITKTEVKREKKQAKPVKVYKPKPTPKPKHVYNQRIIINVHGTVSIEYNEWAYE